MPAVIDFIFLSGGSFNTANGAYALCYNTIGSSNTANGMGALYMNTEGFENTATGYQALHSNEEGNFNTASGYGALINNITGWYNTAIGLLALEQNSSGSGNNAIGNRALHNNKTGNYNTAVGDFANVASENLQNTTAIGYDALVNASNKVFISNEDVTWIGGYVGWWTSSDVRFKHTIREDVKGLDFITKLRPVSYKMDVAAINTHLGVKAEAESKSKYVSNSNKGDIVYSGFIGQEVEAAAREAGYDFSGVMPPQNDKDHYNLCYAEFVVPLVKAVQEQQAMIEDMRNEIAALKKRLGE